MEVDIEAIRKRLETIEATPTLNSRFQEMTERDKRKEMLRIRMGLSQEKFDNLFGQAKSFMQEGFKEGRLRVKPAGEE